MHRITRERDAYGGCHLAGPLLILGASVRAAAQSAARAGLRPICGDLFFDADLPAVAGGQVARSFPGDLLRIAEQAPAAPWMYTGGVENYPRLVARISRDRELLGTMPDALRRVRNPFEVERALHEAGFLFPDCRAMSDGLPRDGTWLRKSRASSAGLRVTPWSEQFAQSGRRGWYFQRRIEGLPMSAVYLAAHGRCCLLGATQQILTGSGPLPFQYAGSIGPLQLTQSQCATVAKVGEFIADRFGVRGLFGVDFVLSGDQLWTIEINPRYTASTEVLERSRGFSAIALLAAAWGKIPPFFQPNLANATNLCGKRIVYAGRERIVDEKMVQGLFERNLGRTWPQVADIPRAATRLLPGHPALTVFAEGQSQASLHAQLQTMQEEIRSEFVF